MKLFDTHAHIDDARFDDDIDGLVGRSREAGLVGTVAIGTTVEASEKCCALASRFADVYAAVGIQPTYVGKQGSGDWDSIVRLAEHPRVVAVGETGIDCYWEDNEPLDVQRDYFERHLQLSRDTGLPFIVHMRESGNEILEVLSNAPDRSLRGVMHSFTGDWALARRCLDLGMHISFAGMVTFKNAGDLREVAKQVPMDRIMIETDSPYLTPHPHRGKRPNEPHYVQHTARCLAEVRGMDPEEFAERTTRNACQFFQLDGKSSDQSS